MIRQICIGALMACAFPFAASAAPAPSEFKAVADKPSVALDPAKSYVLIDVASGGGTPLMLVRRPEQAEIDDYRTRRTEALEKAHAKWVKRHASWVAELARWKKLSSADRQGYPRPEEPVEPTDLNLAFPALDQENMVSIGPMNRFAKAGGRSTYLHMLPPGRYALYGLVSILDAVTGTCMCMGSIEFDVGPGQIVHAGTLKLNLWDERVKAKAEGRPLPPTDMDLPETMNSLSWEPPGPDIAVDPRLSAYKVVPADLWASQGFPNYFGIQIDRMTPVPGVLAYERDRIIDVKAAAQTGTAGPPAS